MPIRVLTWNLFHARDGHPEARQTWRSTLRRRPVEGGGHLHLNRKYVEQMADVIARADPDVAALQEVPVAGVATIARRTRMAAAWITTGPLLGPVALRDRWAASNPDLWRTHESNANVLLVGRRLAGVPGSLRRVWLNTPRGLLGAARALRPPAREVMHWAGERRGMVAATLRTAGGGDVAAGCLHLHNSHVHGIAAHEAGVAAAAMRAHAGAPAAGILAGDVNVPPGHPAHTVLRDAGWQDAGPDRGIDRILHRGLEVVTPPRALDAGDHEIHVPHRGRWWPVRLSDHAPVVGVFRTGAARHDG